MTVLPMLEEDECYLWAILSDPSGLDIAEFLVTDETSKNKDGEYDGCFRAWPFQWCFAGDTVILTQAGYRPIRECLGSVRVLSQNDTGQAVWVDAEVKSFGMQPTMDLVLERYGETITITTTPNHRWFADGGRRRDRTYPEVITADLEPGMFLKSCHPRRLPGLVVSPSGVAHGAVWGDGTLSSKGGADIVLWGEKLDVLSQFFYGEGSPQSRPDVSVPGARWSHLPAYFKSPVDLARESASYLYGWLAGYFATDGSISEDGQCKITSTSSSSLEVARDVCLRLGITTGRITSQWYDDNGFGEPGFVYALTIERSGLSADFFLRPSHRARFTEASYRPREWKVVSVEYTGVVEEVFCAVVPDYHRFVLDGYILTSNCWWRSEHPRQISQGSRSLGKSLSVRYQALAFPFIHPGQEMVITAPESNHLDALTDNVETVFVNNRLPAEMLVRGRNGIKHRPFHMSFVNGARIMGRIPQRDGKGVKGCLCEGELVLTDQGFTPVEELRAGDKVVTHTGALKSIVRVAVDVNDCYEVRGAGSLPMRVSCDHRFYGAAEEGDGFSELFFADVETLVEDGFHWAMPTSFPALPVPPSDLPLQDPSFWGQLGERLAQECHDDDDMSQFIAEHFSEGIPPFVLSLPLLCRKLLLEGFFGSRWHPEGEWVTTLEKRWALSVQMLLCSVGVQPELHAAEGGVVLRAPHSGRVARDGVMLGKVESVVPIGKQKVYNPIVEEDHSYISGSVISHNIHPIWLATDESQDFPEAGWLEIIETLKQGEDDAVWKCYGVTRGVRDKFYEFTQPDSGWEVHHYPAMYRPTWTAEEREAKIQLYGHRDNPDFRRNVYGLHGDATSPLFVLTRLMQCVQEDESDQYNTEEYWNLSIDEADIRDYGGDIMPLLDPPSLHKSMYKKFWIGMDVGFTNDPSVIVVFAEHKEKKTSPTALKLLAKVSMKRVSHGDQVQAIMWFIDHYRPSAFAMDRTGLGLPLFQHIQELVREDRKLAHVLDRIKGYNFSEKIVAELDDTIEVDEYDPKALEKREIKKTVLEHSSDVLRGLVDEGRLVLPWDRDLIGEFKGQTYSYDKSTMDMYGRRRKVFSSGSYHTLDACRMAALAFKQHKIEEFLKEDRFEPVDAIILDL